MTKTGEKRKYTFSDKCLAARRTNALKSTGPTSDGGKAAAARNGWRHGLHAASTARGINGKPCVSTCHKYPCPLVDDGSTRPGSYCLDKEFFLDTFNKMQAATRGKRLYGRDGIFGFTQAQNLSILNDLQNRIMSEGTVVKKAKRDRGGKVIGWKHVLNPAMPALLKMSGVCGISFDSLQLTPASRAKAARGKKAGHKEDDTIIIIRILERMTGRKANK